MRHRWPEPSRSRYELNEMLPRRHKLATMADAAADARRGLRSSLRSPLFAAAVIVLVALGIGSTTAMFSIVRSALLSPLPFPDADRLVGIFESEGGTERVPLSPPNYLDFASSNRTFAAMAAVSPHGYNLANGGEPQRLTGGAVSEGIFDVLGVTPALGRSFSAAETTPGGPPVVVLSDRLWRERYEASPDVLGTSLVLNGEVHTVIGVMPPDFDVPTPWSEAGSMELWTPLQLSGAFEERDSHWLLALGRLTPGVEISQAQADLDTIAAGLAAAYPKTNHGHGATVLPLRRLLLGGHSIQLLTLLIATLLVHLIACANTSGLALTRIAGRETELAVRRSLGAGEGRIAAQFLAESLPLVAVGGGVGLVLTRWALGALVALLPSTLPLDRAPALDVGAVLFAAALTLATAALIIIAPLLVARRLDVAAVSSGRRGTVSGTMRHRVRRVVVTAQLALTVVLGNGAALMLASYVKVQTVDYGFQPEGTIVSEMILPPPRYEGVAPVAALAEDLVPRLGSLPGVEAAAATTKLPLIGGTNGRVVIEGRESEWGEERGPLVERSFVTPGYFAAMGIARLTGRLLEAPDVSSGQAVAVVNRRFARLAWGDKDPVGKRFSLENDGQWITVVGTVDDVRQWGPETPAIPEYYFPLSTHSAYWSGWQRQASRLYVVCRTQLDVDGVGAAIRRTVLEADPGLPVADVFGMNQLLASTLARRRMNTVLIAAFALVAALLAATGTFALMSTVVAHQRHAIGVRLALGARRNRIVALVARQSAGLVAGGLGLGCLAGVLTSRALASMLYDVGAVDILVFALGTATVAAVGLAGGLLPALHASRVDPAVVLRDAG